MKSLLIVILLSIVTTIVSSQTKERAPINWETYRISDQNISIHLPKLPTRDDSNNVCDEIETRQYWTYAANVAYGLRIVSKSKVKIPSWCSEKRRFNRVTFDNRTNELERTATKILNADELIEQWNTQSGSVLEKRWIIDDLKRDRWIEVIVTGYGQSFAKESDFLKSVKVDQADELGKEIGDGSPVTLGDDIETVPLIPADSVPKNVEREPLRVIAKVKARYTDAARQANIQGTVTLRVVFLSNGGFGSISVIKELPYGLTEQAIAAAKKIIFFPDKINGVARTISKPVTFTFNIY